MSDTKTNLKGTPLETPHYVCTTRIRINDGDLKDMHVIYYRDRITLFDEGHNIRIEIRTGIDGLYSAVDAILKALRGRGAV